MKISIQEATLSLLKKTNIPDIITLAQEVKKKTKTKWNIDRLTTNIKKLFETKHSFQAFFYC